MFVGRVMFISLDNEGSNGKLPPLGLAEDFLNSEVSGFLACLAHRPGYS